MKYPLCLGEGRLSFGRRPSHFLKKGIDKDALSVIYIIQQSVEEERVGQNADGTESCGWWDRGADGLAEWTSEGERNAAAEIVGDRLRDAASRRDGGGSFVTKVQHMLVCAERAEDSANKGGTAGVLLLSL